MKMRRQTIASNVSIRTISPTATPLPKAYDCVAVYIAGRRTTVSSYMVVGRSRQPKTEHHENDNDNDKNNNNNNNKDTNSTKDNNNNNGATTI